MVLLEQKKKLLGHDLFIMKDNKYIMFHELFYVS